MEGWVIREVGMPGSGTRSIPDELSAGGTGLLRGVAVAAALGLPIWSGIVWGITRLV
jgi:hypothetical protein